MPDTDSWKTLNDERTDCVLADIAADIVHSESDAFLMKLSDAGILRYSSGKWRFACPVFLESDLNILKALTQDFAEKIAEKLLAYKDKYIAIVDCLDKRFPPERHLYHLLCGAVFDGRFFSRLADACVLTDSKPQQNGQDYLPVIYEDAPSLNSFSAEILCSYNRLTAKKGTFVSFGDAAGDRKDFFRWYQHLTRGKTFFTTYKMNRPLPEFREELAEQFVLLINGHGVKPEYAELFETFGYTKSGTPAVPVYTAEQMRETVTALDDYTAELILEDMITALKAVASAPGLTAIRHSVPIPDIANEVYHLLFGQINEALVSRGFAPSPEYRPGEGRYLKCFEIN